MRYASPILICTAIAAVIVIYPSVNYPVSDKILLFVFGFIAGMEYTRLVGNWGQRDKAAHEEWRGPKD